MPKQNLDEEREVLELEMRKLELENLRFTVEQQRSIMLQRKMHRERIAEVISQENAQNALYQANCKHRKGGKNKAGFLNGSDNYYSVIHHTYPEGRLVVMCTRCQSQWEKPPQELRKEDPAAYKQQMADFQTALNWPTDNEPSGTQLFLIQRTA
jgi:hypothetical protein